MTKYEIHTGIGHGKTVEDLGSGAEAARRELTGMPIYDTSRMTLTQLAELDAKIRATPGMQVLVVSERVVARSPQEFEGTREVKLPSDLEENYELLWAMALRAPQAVSSGDPVQKARGLPVTRLSTSQTETRGGAKGSRKSGKSADLIRSEAAFVFKGRMDRKLRKLSREIKAWMEGSESTVEVRRCSVCRQYGDSEWLYCPKDGKPMVSESTRRNDG